MTAELKNLRIDRSRKPVERSRPLNSRARWVIAAAIGLAVAIMAGFFVSKLTPAPEVRVMRVHAASPSSTGGPVILSATGYIVPAHQIEVAAKVIGKVAWIGVEKGDKVAQEQVLVRLEDDEYRAHLLEAQGQLAYLKTHLAELVNGSRPQEIARANADLNQAGADLEMRRSTCSARAFSPRTAFWRPRHSMTLKLSMTSRQQGSTRWRNRWNWFASGQDTKRLTACERKSSRQKARSPMRRVS